MLEAAALASGHTAHSPCGNANTLRSITPGTYTRHTSTVTRLVLLHFYRNVTTKTVRVHTKTVCTFLELHTVHGSEWDEALSVKASQNLELYQ